MATSLAFMSAARALRLLPVSQQSVAEVTISETQAEPPAPPLGCNNLQILVGQTFSLPDFHDGLLVLNSIPTDSRAIWSDRTTADPAGFSREMTALPGRTIRNRINHFRLPRSAVNGSWQAICNTTTGVVTSGNTAVIAALSHERGSRTQAPVAAPSFRRLWFLCQAPEEEPRNRTFV